MRILSFVYSPELFTKNANAFFISTMSGIEPDLAELTWIIHKPRWL